MASVFPEGSYRQFYSVIADASETVVYTCPATGFLAAYILWVTATDDASDARTITLAWRDSSAAVTVSLNVAAAIAANTAFEREFKPLVLEPGDTLRVTASAGGMHVTGAVIEIARTGRS